MTRERHSRAQTDSNYGNILALFDRGFGTFRSSDEAFGVSYGLEGSDPARIKSFQGLMTLPFRAP